MVKPTAKKAAKSKARLEAARLTVTRHPVNAAYLDKPAHLRTRQERTDAGKAQRVTCPRESQAGFKPDPARPDPIDILIASSEGRIAELIPIRYGRMMASPFAFYRGAAAIMAASSASGRP